MPNSTPAREGELAPRHGASRIAAALAVASLAVYWTLGLHADNAWGWDETMHVGRPAWRMLLAASSGDFAGVSSALHDCDRYPFVFPVVVALWQAIFGATEETARQLSTLVWCAALWGVFLLARAIGERLDDPQRAHRLPWIALALAATCPLALSFAGTLMLEIPSVCVAVFALRAWVRRDGSRGRDLAAGAWLCAAFFTKFNYGLLLWSALAIDHAMSAASAWNRSKLAPFLRQTTWLVLLPALALAWWFLAPLPFGLERAAEHRAAFAEWIAGNQSAPETDWKRRALNLAASFAFDPRMLAVLAIGAVAALRDIGKPAVRSTVLACVVMGVAILAHPFHLPRFLIPIGAALWPLSAIGWSHLLPRSLGGYVISWFALGCAVGLAPGTDTRVLASSLGLLSDKPETRAYQESVLAGYRDLSASRHIQAAGLAVDDAHAFLDVAAKAIRPDERVAWIDLTEEISPSGLQFGLWKRGGSKARTLAQLPEQNYVSIDGVDPKWTDQQLTEFAGRYDVILFTEPHNLKGKRDREFFAGYVQRLEASGWKRERAGDLSFARPAQQAPLAVAVFTLRRASQR